MGKLTYKELMIAYGRQMLPDSNGYVRQAKRVTKRIVDQTNLGNLDWEVHIINSNDPPNAFVLPGGKVFIFSSILPIMKDEDGMATVLSHEIAHQLARHQDEKLSSAPFYLALSLIGALVFQTTQFSDILLNLFLELPASRQMESEADYIGLMTMSKACYNPAEAINVWTRMQRATGRFTPQQFLSTHPSPTNRIEKMREWQDKALQERRDAGCDSLNGYAPSFWNYNQL